MKNFAVDFSHPLVLLLIAGAFLATLIPYFMLSKKYRKTRNRITSMVLHLIIMVLAITIFAGIKFTYQKPNEENEILLLVDVSDSEEQSAQNRDEVINTILGMGKYDGYKIGIVTFGFDQRYAVPLTDKVNKIYDTYKSADLPDTSATNTAAAFRYAKTLLSKPESAKIVLISDGKETDEEAIKEIGSISAQGIKVDTVFVPSDSDSSDIQVVDTIYPDQHIGVGEQVILSATVFSKKETVATIQIFDNEDTNIANDIISINLSEGLQTVKINHTFEKEGLHEIKIKVNSAEDINTENNIHHSYIYLENFNKVLILEKYNGESDKINQILSKDDRFDVVVKNISDENTLPATIDEMRVFDQVILNNIANKDMPAGFVELLYTYVYEYGGGLFTVGGSNPDGTANAYNRSDMLGTLYQSMLPVQAINYTPPIGVMVIIDRSGSMATESGVSGMSNLDWAKAGASSCLSALSERDYIGVMTLDSTYDTILPMTPCTQVARINAAIDDIPEATGGTVFPDAIDRAGQALIALKNVDKRHIIIVTDGGVPDSQVEDYENFIDKYYKNNGITLSVVAIGITEYSSEAIKMKHAVEIGHGYFYAIDDGSKLINRIRNDLNAPEIEEVNLKEFSPSIYNPVSSVVKGIEHIAGNDNKSQVTFSLDGFYGVKVRKNVDLVLVGDYEVPIYAQWKFGKGMVGSFMSDLNGKEKVVLQQATDKLSEKSINWSSKMLNDDNGKQLLINIVKNLMPTENIRSKEINALLSEENYMNQISVFTSLEAGQKIVGNIYSESTGGNLIASLNESGNKDSGCYITSPLSENNNYSRSSFVLKDSGVYRIELKKVDENGNVLSTENYYKVFSYSKEYDIQTGSNEEKLKKLMTSIAAKGRGVLVADNEDPIEIFNGFVVALDNSYDPRFLFMIIAIILFLLDIAVRKFKFKWPHELVREYKEKKN